MNSKSVIEYYFFITANNNYNSLSYYNNDSVLMPMDRDALYDVSWLHVIDTLQISFTALYCTCHLFLP